MELFNLFKDLFMALTSTEYLHCLLGNNCDHIIFVLGSSSCILPKEVLMFCIKLFNGVLPTSLAPQCKMRYCGLSLTFSNVLIFLYISNHTIPPFPCHQIFIPNLCSPKHTPPGLFLAATNALFTIEEPTTQTWNSATWDYIIRTNKTNIRFWYTICNTWISFYPLCRCPHQICLTWLR